MKIELIKETKPSGDVFYKTFIDDVYVDHSVNMDLELAKQTYHKIILSKGEANKEIIESVDL